MDRTNRFYPEPQMHRNLLIPGLVVCMLLVQVVAVHAYTLAEAHTARSLPAPQSNPLMPLQGPLAVNDGGEGFITGEDFSFTTASVLANDSHPEGTPIFIQDMDTTGTIGLVTRSDGSKEFFTTTLLMGIESSHGIAIQPDGKILASGYAYNGENHYDFALWRYSADGSIDTTFDGDGLVTTDFGAVEQGFAIALQPDGKVLVAGHVYSNTADTYSIGLVRYQLDGSLDVTFDGDGKTTIDAGRIGTSGMYYGIALQEDQKIVIASTAYDDAAYKIIVARLNPDGSLDPGFDEDGITLTGVLNYTLGKDVAIQPDQKIVVSGHFADMTGSGFVLARFLPDGSLDPGFDDDGLQITYASSSTSGLGQAIALQPDGKILSAGFDDNDITVVRYNPDGSPDPTFDGDGIIFTDFGPYDLGNDIVALPTGKILVVGRGTYDISTPDILLLRYNADGSPDLTFGGDGAVISNEFGHTDSANAVALDGKGGILVVGDLQPGAFLARFTDSGAFSYDPQGQFNDLNEGDYAYDTFSYVVSDGVLTDTARVTITVAGAVDTSYAYLPVLINYSPIPVTPGISGQVNAYGLPAGGVSLALRFYDGSNWSTRLTTTTGADGKYLFTDVPSLESGQTYYVLYRNQSDPSRLFIWGTRDISTYSEGELVALGSFDIGNVELVSPVSGATVGIPVTFQWVPRPNTPTDSYELDIFDQEEDEPYFYTDPPLGYINTYILTWLPSGFKVGTEYLWDIWINSPDGGFGISYWSHYITFGSSAAFQDNPYLPSENSIPLWRGKDPASLR